MKITNSQDARKNFTVVSIAASCLYPAPPECEEGSLRLVDGAVDNEGRVEICLEGVWGTVLSNSNWTSVDAHIACKQINFGTSGIGKKMKNLALTRQF